MKRPVIIVTGRLLLLTGLFSSPGPSHVTILLRPLPDAAPMDGINTYLPIGASTNRL